MGPTSFMGVAPKPSGPVEQPAEVPGQVRAVPSAANAAAPLPDGAT